jgi:hypothetical protein
MLILNDKHIALHSCEEVKKICLPLFNKTKISYFTFLRYYNDHSRIYLTSNPAWVEFFLRTVCIYIRMGIDFLKNAKIVFLVGKMM